MGGTITLVWSDIGEVLSKPSLCVLFKFTRIFCQGPASKPL